MTDTERKLEPDAMEPDTSSHPLEDHPEYVFAIGMISLEAVAIELRLALLLARALTIPLRTAQVLYLTAKAEATRIEIFRNAASAALAVPAAKSHSELDGRKSALSQTLIRF